MKIYLDFCTRSCKDDFYCGIILLIISSLGMSTPYFAKALIDSRYCTYIYEHSLMLHFFS